MTDIPIYTGVDGIATLILHEIPYRREGYVLVRSVFGTLEGLLQECAGVCRTLGAQKVFAGGEADFSGHTPYARLMERSVPCKEIPSTTAVLQPVTEETAQEWAQRYNERFREVPTAQTCTPYEIRRLAQSGEAFFVLEDGQRIGLGRVSGDRLSAVAALQPRAGRTCVCALAQQIKGEKMHLTCAVENERAMHLYDALGFSRGEISQSWYWV